MPILACHSHLPQGCPPGGVPSLENQDLTPTRSPDPNTFAMTTLIRGRSFDVRTVTKDDKDAVLAVYRECEDFLALGPQPNATMAMVLKDMEMARQQGALFCGIHDVAGRMIGVVEFARSGFEGKPDVAFISLLMIVPGLRGRGIGTETVRLIEREIRKDLRVTMIRSAVQVNNTNAQRFWLKHGYRIIGGPELQPDGTTVLHLQKDCSQVT